MIQNSISLAFRAAYHPLRTQIVDFLRKNPQFNVTKIYLALKLEQSVVSQHLAILRKSRLVVSKRSGKFIHYEVNEDGLALLGQIQTLYGEKFTPCKN